MYDPKSSDLGLYIHIPFCLKKCGYCSFVSYEKCDHLYDDYVDALIKEIRKADTGNRKVKTVYFGGGTPSLLKPQHIYNIMDVIYDKCDVAGDAEITMEANPGTVDHVKLRDFRECCINRLSLGIQSTDDDDLRYLERIHDRATALQAIKDASKVFDNVSCDLIYGLPQRSIDTWEKVLREVSSMEIKHISMYALTLEDDTPLGKKIAEGKAAPLSEDQEADEYELIDKTRIPFEQYEISNWSKRGYESKHNVNYWERGDYLGFGVAAHSCMGRVRSANTSDITKYLDSLKKGDSPEEFREELNDEKILGETVMLALRMAKGVSINDIKTIFNVEFEDKYKNEIRDLAGLGLIERTEIGYKLTKKGRLLGNQVFVRFIE